MTAKNIYSLLSKRQANIVTDSRKVNSGDIFFALRGDNFDANRFAADALKKGAIKAIIDDPDYVSENTILVDDVLKMLQDIARLHRESFKIPVLAITGTNGKTTTKELLARVLSRKFIVHYTRGNLNNHIGLPLTILDADPESTFMIVEMGANHIGEIADLCRIALPTAGLITNIGKAHLEGFGSFEGVVQAKSELYKYLAENSGTIIYNDGNPLLKEIAGKFSTNIIPYSKPANILEQGKVEQGSKLILEYYYNKTKYKIESDLVGVHNSENIMAALAVALNYGVDINEVIEAIQTFKPRNNRSQLLETKSNTLICDAYNANPESMSLAINSFLSSASEKKVAILGDMLELGEYSIQEHEAILDILKHTQNIDVYLVGSIFREVSAGSGLKVYKDAEQLISELKMKPIQDSLVLIKGSRGIGLERVYNYL